jgi:predicted nucleic-acid-binding protein
VIGLDTNVLIRYIAQDDPIQSPRAVRLVEKECTPDTPGFIGLITLAELVWVSESCYMATKEDLVAVLRRLLSTKQLVVQNAEIAWQALRMFESGKADFADYLVERIASAAGCANTVTFDQLAAKSGMTLLK